MALSPYSPPKILFNAHLETIFPALFRRIESFSYTTERIETPDDDFLDIDWIRNGSSRLVIISHGLEGNSQRPYIRGMASAFAHAGYDVAAWNYRGCGPEMNRQRRFYHSGATDDLDVVIRHAMTLYDEIYLIGFSLGGNLTLKYLGERGAGVPAAIRKAVAFSTPLELHTSCQKISLPENWIYSRRFLKSLKKKVLTKAARRNDLDVTGLDQIKSLLEFDDQFTAPIHGFDGAIDYYRKSSALYVLSTIARPTLIVNAKNDPFLSEDCFPVNALSNHPYVKLEVPLRGGHVGFALFNQNGLYWSELRALDFIRS